jgi:type IV secretory pathway TrbD component
MVGPSLTPEEYAAGVSRLRLTFVVLVGASGALIALANGAGLLLAAVAFVAALALGGVLVWYLGVILPGAD